VVVNMATRNIGKRQRKLEPGQRFAMPGTLR